MTLQLSQLEPRQRAAARRGFTFIELAISAAMVAVLLALIGQMLVFQKRHSQAAERRAFAMQTVENALEAFASRPWTEIDDAQLAELKLPESVTKRWPKAVLEGEVVETTDPVSAKRISLELTLNPEASGPPARLSTWIHRQPAAQEEE